EGKAIKPWHRRRRATRWWAKGFFTRPSHDRGRYVPPSEAVLRLANLAGGVATGLRCGPHNHPDLRNENKRPDGGCPQEARKGRNSSGSDEPSRAQTVRCRLRRFAQLRESNYVEVSICWYRCWYLDVAQRSKTEQNRPSDRHFGHHPD